MSKQKIRTFRKSLLYLILLILLVILTSTVCSLQADIAALKKLISQSNIFLRETIVDEERLDIIDDFDTTGIKVMDIMHNAENKDYYRDNNANFANVITKILNDNNFEIAIRNTKIK